MKKLKKLKDFKQLVQDKINTDYIIKSNELEQCKQQYAQLKQYQSDYYKNIFSTDKGTVQSSELNQVSAFIDNISFALKQQEIAISNLEEIVNQKSIELKNAMSETKSLDKIIEKRALDEKAVEERKEQNEMDEYGKQIWLRNNK